jgi:hypothetical protein
MMTLLGIVYLCHCNGINPLQAMMMMNMMNAARRGGMGYGGMGYRGMGGMRYGTGHNTQAFLEGDHDRDIDKLQISVTQVRISDNWIAMYTIRLTFLLAFWFLVGKILRSC